MYLKRIFEIPLILGANNLIHALGDNGNGASASTAYYNSMLALIAVFAAAAVTL